MRLQTSFPSWRTLKADLLVVPISAGEAKSLSKPQRKPEARFGASGLINQGGKRLAEFLKRSGFKGKRGESCLVTTAADYPRCPVLCVGWEPPTASVSELLDAYRDLGALIARCTGSFEASSCALAAESLDLSERINLEALLEGLELAQYTFDRYRSKSRKTKKLQSLTILAQYKVPSSAARTVRALTRGTFSARDLINTPALDCGPEEMVAHARQLADRYQIKFQLYNESKLEKMGARTLLGVGKGSSRPTYLVKLTYKPAQSSGKRLALVGKGITFDSGGLSLKPGPSMESMKSDMGGAAAVLGAMEAIAALKPKVEVRAYVPLAENMVSGDSIRPGDVIETMSGKTVEILNTDAEGRLILADALALAVQEECDLIVDVATLTGACVVALGENCAGLFSNDDDLAGRLRSAGEQSGEMLWRLPLIDSYSEKLKSPIADLKNIGGRAAGAITAALFLKEFVGKKNWAHLDIAGPAMSDKDKGHLSKGAVGFGARTLARFAVELGAA